MELKKGIAVSPGVVIREALVLDTEEIRIPQRFVEKENVDGELGRLEQAIVSAQSSIDHEIERMGPKLPIKTDIMNLHKELLSDPILSQEFVRNIQENQYTAEHAVSRVLNRYIKKLEGLDSPIISERIHDLHDVEKLILNTLLGKRIETIATLEKEVILVASNLTPSQTAKLDTRWVKGIATDMGGKTSHTAIMARALGIPAVVALENLSSSALGGDLVIIDGFRGVVIVNPDSRTIAEYREKEANVLRFARRLKKETELPSETLDGYPIEIHANVELPQEVHSAVDLGAMGIGLFRSEFIHLQSGRNGEEAHFQSYKTSVRELGNLPLTIRTLDLGGDKNLDATDLPAEANPFLGCRSIRYCFAHPEMFREQLRAILRVSAFGKVRIMLPMVGSLSEYRRAQLLLDQVKDELRAEGIAFDPNIPLGIMVEVPSVALTAEMIAPEVDFFSVGTNDLAMYTLAVDRGNEMVASLYDPAHPAILRLLVRTLEAGELAGIDVSLCGEMASDPLCLPLLVGLGYRNISVSPLAIPEVKRIIRSMEVHASQDLARRCLECVDGHEVARELRRWSQAKLPEVLRRW